MFTRLACNRFVESHIKVGAPQLAQTVKNPPAMWETRVGSLDFKDPLKDGTATHSSVLAWRIPGTEEPGGLQSAEAQRVKTRLCTHIYKMKNHRHKPLVLFLEQDLINILFCSSCHLLNISVLQLV